ncbi:MAG: hypothetical protein JWP64_6230 [Pseudonocardia sp.]|nr:hypothetical protein [Pseudonocardia sp.]
MTEKKSITITGRDLRDSTFGIGTVTSNRGAGTPTTLADLRTAPDVHAEGIIVLAPTESEQAAIRHEIDATRRELTAGKPDAQAVRFPLEGRPGGARRRPVRERGRRADQPVRDRPVLVSACAGCAAEMRPGARFCTRCGTPAAVAEQALTGPTVTEPPTTGPVWTAPPPPRRPEWSQPGGARGRAPARSSARVVAAAVALTHRGAAGKHRGAVRPEERTVAVTAEVQINVVGAAQAVSATLSSST